MKKIIILIAISLNLGAQTNNTIRYLDKNKVKTRINTTNDKLWNITGDGKQAYEVPAGQGKHVMFGNSIWIGGLDNGGQLKISANTYKQNGTDFWPGPLDTSNFSATPSNPGLIYNRLWKIDCNDIGNFITAFNNGSVSAGTYTIPADILNYPAQGAGNFQKNLNPFVDVNHNGIYYPQQGGDYPLIKGHQQILSIFNDSYFIHTETQGVNMGVEIHERSYAYSEPNIVDSMQAINYTTFYHYTIYNRSAYNYNNVYISDWADMTLGYPDDDFIGSDTLNNFAYCYNSDSNDETNLGYNGYGNKPPVTSIAILNTDCSSDGIDNNHNGQIDESGENFKLDKVTYYNNNLSTVQPPTTNPATAVHYYNYMMGYWKDSSPFTFGGNGYGGTSASPKVYPGDPQNNSGWTESTAGNTPGNKKVLVSSGPFNFPAKSKIEWGYAIVFSQETSMAVNTITQFQQRVQRDVRNIKYYDSQLNKLQCAPSLTYTVTVGIQKHSESKLNVFVYPNPANSTINIDFNENVKGATVCLFDITGRKMPESKIITSNHAQIDLSTFENGVYFMEIRENEKIFRTKVVKN